MTLTVDRLPREAGPEWDAFVKSAGGWTPYQLIGWRRVIEEAHGHECIYLRARDSDGTIRGALPLVRVRSALFGHYLVSMPFLNYGGPLGGPEAVSELVREAVALSTKSGAELLEMRAAGELPVDLSVSHRKITVLLDLVPGRPGEVWDRMPAKLRSQVRRPMKEGVEVRFGPAELDGFYAVFSRHMRDLGTPVLSKRHFQLALEEFPNEIWIGCAYLAGRPVAAGSGFRWRDRFELVWASALREYSRMAPNMLLYWKFIERCADDGVAVFDFGRCTPGGGTHRFKLQWGGHDEPLWWYQHGARSGGGTPSPDSGPYSLGPRLWQRLPLGVANVLGPRIVKYIP